MGYGHYTNEAFHNLRSAKSYAKKTRSQIFTSRHLDPEMDPSKVVLRESRDSEEHPESLSIIIALDVTGSMGFVPEEICKNTLPDLMGSLMEAGIAHPQVLFLGVGDFVYDNAPLQVGQFESSAELLDRWLTKVYLEGGGGGNQGESYNLAYLFAARHTAIDCWEKRSTKGYLFTLGDEPCLPSIPGDVIGRLTCADIAQSVSTEHILAEAQERYRVFHMHIRHGGYSESKHSQSGWRDLMGQHLIQVADYTQVAKQVAQVVIGDLNAGQGMQMAERQAISPAASTRTVEEML